MELVFVVLIAAGVGFALPFLLRGRDTYGAALLPSVSVAVSVIVWVGLLWGLNWQFDGTWIWVAALVAGPLAALGVALALPGKRRESDRTLLNNLSGGKA